MSDSAAKPSAPLPTHLSATDTLLQAVLDVSLTAVALLRPVFGPDGGVPEDFALEYLNPAGQRLLNLPEQPASTVRTLYPHAQETGILDYYRQVFGAEGPARFHVNYPYDGLNQFFHLSARRSGQVLVVSFSDTADHDRLAAEQALRESQAREQAARAETEAQRTELQRVFEQAPVAIAILRGPEYIVELANPTMCAIWGYRPEDIIGKPRFQAMPDVRHQGLEKNYDAVLLTGQPHYIQEFAAVLDRAHTGLPPQGYFNFTFQPLRDAQGHTTGLIAVGVEVTEQVLARRQVQQLNEDMQAANEELRVTNQEFLESNAALVGAQQALQQLNEDLEARVTARTREVQNAQAATEWQRQRLERLFMRAPAAICILDGPDLVYELVNPAYQQLFPGRQLLGQPLLAALPEIAKHDVYRTFRLVYETGITHQELGQLIPLARPEDGALEDRYFNFIQQARHDEGGQVDGVLVFAFEVTEQVRARKAIEASAQQLRLVTDALPVLIGYLDHEIKYRFANQAYEAWFNQKPEALLGRPVREVVGEQAFLGVKKYIDRALAGERVDFEARMPYRENFVKHIQTSYVPDIQEGKVRGFYTLVTDVTGQVEARLAVEESSKQAQALARELATTNEELRVVNQQLLQINADLDNFIYTASHDLKTPILNIEGLMEVLLEDLPPSILQSVPVGRTTELILDSVQRFKRTIDHLTEITKLQKENNMEASPVDLAAVIAEVELDLMPAIQAAGAQLEVAVSACPTIRFPEKNLRSIIYNLLSNAIKYHSPERAPRVRLHTYETPDYLVLAVADNGLGMDLLQDHKLFTMFNRLHDHVEGSGIGLYMVKKIIENSGGKIEVQSKVGEGSVFRVYFRHSS
jgi:two-component system, sensor histidine kinase